MRSTCNTPPSSNYKQRHFQQRCLLPQSLALLWAGFWALLLPSYIAAAATLPHSPFRAELRLERVYETRTQKLDSSAELRRIPTVTMKGRLRNVGFIDARFTIQRNKTWTARISKNGQEEADRINPTLLQGRIAVGGAWRYRGNRILPSSASIIGDTLKLTFPGRAKGSKASRQRIYTITMKLDGSLVVKASILSIPRSAGRRGACSSAVGIGSLAQHLKGSEAVIHDSADSTISPIIADEQARELSRVITISTDADEAWYQRYGEQSNAVIAGIVNTAEVIYNRQLGLRFRIVQQHVYASGSPYTATDASKLLASFAMNRDNKVNLGNGADSYHTDVDLKHLFTGRDLDGATIGIAYIGTLCTLPSMAFGVTQAYADGANAAIFAHELGHNFGANHDLTSPDGLMYPAISFPPAQKFSEVSLNEMQTHLTQYGTCVSLEELASLPQQQPIPNVTEPTPSPLSPTTLTLKQRKIRQQKQVIIRLSGELSSSSSQPISKVGVLLVVDGKEVARTVTNSAGKYDFLIRVRLPRGKEISALAKTEGYALVSTQLQLTRTVS